VSLTYHALDPEAPARVFDVNHGGAHLLAFIHHAAGASVFSDRLARLLHLHSLRVPFSATAEEAREAATLIARTPDDTLRAIMDEKAARYCFGGTSDEFVEFAREWQAFLEQCGGYDVDPP
jgi:hypothetical protein